MSSHWIKSLLFGKPQESAMAKEYLLFMYSRKRIQPSMIISALLFPLATTFVDTGTWVRYGVFRTPYLWLLTIIYLVFCFHLIESRKKIKTPIRKLNFYFASSFAISIFISIMFGIRAFIMSGSIQFIVLSTAICIFLASLAWISAVKLMNWAIVKINRENREDAVRKKISRRGQYKRESRNYAGVGAVLFAFFILPRIMPEDITDGQFIVVFYMIFFFCLSFMLSATGYVAYLIKKFDFSDIEV